jgi:DNA-binding NarL/FixJ family response regulator
MKKEPFTHGSGPESKRIRVLVADDHAAFRQALASALGMIEDIVVIAEASDGDEAYEEAEELHPDVVLMDLSMPEQSGIEAMRRMHESQPGLPIVLLTAHADAGVEREAIEAGATRVVTKGAALDDIVIVLHEAAEERETRSD